MDSTSTAVHVAAIHNAAWMVRYYCRPMQRAQRARALHELGLACREAFNRSEDFEALLIALLDGLLPRDERRF